MAVAAPGIDYVVAPGEPPQAIGALTAITGRHRVPPEWAVGTQLDRAVKYPGDNARGARGTRPRRPAHIERYGLPLDAYRDRGLGVLLARQPARAHRASCTRRGIRPDPLLPRVRRQGRDRHRRHPRDYDEAVAKGYVAKTPTGQPYVFVSNFNERAALIDFTNPEAVRGGSGRIREALDLGADGFMQDFGEQVQSDMLFHDGETGATMHNRYPVLVPPRDARGRERCEREHPAATIFFYTRAGYTGTPGAARTRARTSPATRRPTGAARRASPR